MSRIIFILFFSHPGFSCEAIWNNGPTQLLNDIFDISKIKEVQTLEDAVKVTSFKFLRPKFMESWHAYSILNREQKSKLEALIKDSDLFKIKMPQKKHYDVFVVCCGWYEAFINRIEFLVELHRQGIRFDKIYLLGSSRDIRQGSRSERNLITILKQKNLPLEEMTMIEYLWQEKQKPEDLKQIPLQFFKVRTQQNDVRPIVGEALMEVVKSCEIKKGESYLIITNNPYVCMHDAMAKKLLSPFEVIVETVGDAMYDDPIEDVLDSIARCLYNLQ